MLENSWVAERLVASREGFNSIELVGQFVSYLTTGRLPFIPAGMKPDLFQIFPDYRAINTYFV
jgi:hypothetical protein